MDSHDLHEITMRLAAVRGRLGSLDNLSSALQDGFVHVSGGAATVTLTARQKDQLRQRFDSLADRVELVADKMPDPSGKLGSPNMTEVKAVQDRPALLVRLLDQSAQKLASAAVGGDVGADGTVTSTISDEAAQQVADGMATVRDAVKHVVGVFRLRAR